MNKVRFSVRTLLACLSLLCVGLSIRQMVAAGVLSVIAGYHFTCALVTMFVIVKELNEASGSGIREHLYVFGTSTSIIGVIYGIDVSWALAENYPEYWNDARVRRLIVTTVVLNAVFSTVYSIILVWSIKRIMRCLAGRIWE